MVRLALILGFLLAAPTLASDMPDRIAALAAAAEIDRLVDETHLKHGITPNEPLSDERFARRVYLDIAGRIPTYDELTEFLESGESNKRYDLIDRLLDSEGYVSHSYNYWADVLRVKTRLVNQVSGVPYIQWVKAALRDNMPYDRFVYELLTAQGKVTEDGAAGYLLRDTGMPLDNMANTVRIFLGTRIGCAQCHDHPYDKWTQHEFYEMAAFTAGVDTRQRVGGGKRDLRKLREGLSQREQQVLQRLLQTESFAVSDTKKRLRLPADYKYKDAKPGDVIEPHTIFGEPAETEKAATPRVAFASWLTDRGNPRFATVIANRLWKRAMGLGLVEPVDDFTDDTEASIPELLEYLTGLTTATYFDIKAVSRAIYYSKTYQRQASVEEPPAGRPYHFPGPVLRRMTAEQMWDSVLTLVVPDLDGREGTAVSARQMAMMEVDIEEMSPEEIVAKAREIAATLPAPGGGRPEKGVRRRVIERINDEQPEKYRGLPPDFVRASESPAPAPPGTFLEQFGASDRELVEGSTDEPTVTQALEMLNGRMANGVLDGRSMLSQSIRYGKTPQQRARIIFVSVLGREPSPDEAGVMTQELRNDPKNGLRNVAAALLNTREFMFIQ